MWLVNAVTSCLILLCVTQPSAFHQNFEKGLGLPGALQSSEYLLLAGPVDKYLLQGCMNRKQQAAVFDYLDLPFGKTLSLKSAFSSWKSRRQLCLPS